MKSKQQQIQKQKTLAFCKPIPLLTIYVFIQWQLQLRNVGSSNVIKTNAYFECNERETYHNISQQTLSKT